MARKRKRQDEALFIRVVPIGLAVKVSAIPRYLLNEPGAWERFMIWAHTPDRVEG